MQTVNILCDFSLNLSLILISLKHLLSREWIKENWVTCTDFWKILNCGIFKNVRNSSTACT